MRVPARLPRLLGVFLFSTALLPSVACAEVLSIVSVEPTVFYPKVKAGEPLRQLVRLGVKNAAAAVDAKVRIHVIGMPAYDESLGTLPTGDSAKAIHVPDVNRPTKVNIELFSGKAAEPVVVKRLVVHPQKKWKLYCVSYSHHDLGFGNYPHRLRTDIRHANIELPLQFCRETDSWDEDSRFRYVIETSEPITSFLATHSEADAAELARRIREGRIQVGGVHTTVNTEQMSHELLARLFYLTNRHTRDLLDIPAAKTAQIDDVIGLTWPLATMCHEADIPYFFHGHNGTADCLRPASLLPLFFWQGPDGRGKVLVRSTPYGGYAGDSLGDGSDRHIEEAIAKFAGPAWPYGVMLLQDGTDFRLATRDSADKVHAWNARWAYPHLVCATMDMFFEAVAAEADLPKIKTFAKDGNNQWADQDSAAANTLTEARKQGEAIPTAEKFATIATTLCGGNYPWTDIYQAYHRLLLYHEHTDGPDNAFLGTRENVQRVETEQAELREMADDAKFFADRTRNSAIDRLASQVAAPGTRSVVVFNPLNHPRSDLVQIAVKDMGDSFGLVDAVTQRPMPFERIGENICFVAPDVPSLGYKSFHVVAATSAVPKASPRTANNGVLDNRFYRLQFDKATGAITSIFDKQLKVELVDQAAPHKFNEYLYERFETPDAKVPSKWYRVESAKLEASAGPVAARMTVHASAVGADKIQQSVILYNDLKRIDFVLDLVKSRSGRGSRDTEGDVHNKESVYVALPLKVPDFSFHHEVPGCVEQPVKDLFDGACTAFYAVRHFSDVSNSHYGVTVSAPESSLFEYDHPRSSANPILRWSQGHTADYFEMQRTPPASSRMYLYLMNNMFDTNIPLSQPGPVRFTWSIRSHEGNWQRGRADLFGWETMNPLLAKVVAGSRPANAEKSFLTVDQPNIVCTTIKPAEANGRGVILRFVETQGAPTTASFRASFFGTPAKAVETSLVEADRRPLTVAPNGTVTFAIEPFGVKTIRLVSQANPLPSPSGLAATPVSDREVALQWNANTASENDVAYYRVYRGTKADFQPDLRTLVAQSDRPSTVDHPILYFGGWINNRLDPETTYYYRVATVDRWNNESTPSAVAMATTLKSSKKNALPNRVERLSAIPIAPPGQHPYVNLLFRTNCESDIVRYEIHRSKTSGFAPAEGTRVGELKTDEVIKGSTAYGHTPVDRRMKEYDHAMYADTGVEPSGRYYYRVCAVDASGQKGPFSEEAVVVVGVQKP